MPSSRISEATHETTKVIDALFGADSYFCTGEKLDLNRIDDESVPWTSIRMSKSEYEDFIRNLAAHAGKLCHAIYQLLPEVFKLTSFVSVGFLQLTMAQVVREFDSLAGSRGEILEWRARRVRN